jgi:hypothetical protein
LGQPRLHGVVDEGVIAPLGDFVAERVDILERPSGDRIEEAWCDVGSPGEGLHRLVAVAVARPGSLAYHFALAVEADHAAVGGVGAGK